MFVLGKRIKGRNYYLMQPVGTKPNPKHPNGYWTRKLSKAFRFEIYQEAQYLGEAYIEQMGRPMPERLTQENLGQPLFYGRTFHAHRMLVWFADVSVANPVCNILVFVKDVDKLVTTPVRFEFRCSIDVSLPAYHPSPWREKQKALKEEQKRLLREAFAEARANGVLPS